MNSEFTRKNQFKPGETSSDVLIVGAGLAGRVLALVLRRQFPDLRVILFDERRPVGRRTWSFFASDLSPRALNWLSPWVSRRWEDWEVHFPEYSARYSGAYFSIRSEDFQKASDRALGGVIQEGRVTEVGSTLVKLEGDESRYSAPWVFDCRGWPDRPESKLPQAVQKFVGLELLFDRPHGVERPVIMDARIEQQDGFRFMYALPWDERRILLEDTRYSDCSDLPREEYEIAIREYASQWERGSFQIIEREWGILPIPLSGAWPAPSWEEGAIPMGARGGWFHATTGYTIPSLMRGIESIVDTLPRGRIQLLAALTDLRRSHSWNQRYFRFLNRMLFLGDHPEKRFRSLQFFFARASQTRVERFFRGGLAWRDWIGILATRKPPISPWKALKLIPERSHP